MAVDDNDAAEPPTLPRRDGSLDETALPDGPTRDVSVEQMAEAAGTQSSDAGSARDVSVEETALAAGTPSDATALTAGPSAPGGRSGATTLPARVGRFAILKQLGSGGMGVVYAAYDGELDRKVAVKLVRTDLHDQRPAATRSAMLREAKAMAKVEHPHVITVYDVGTVDDQVFVAMELIDGGDLRTWMTAAIRGWRDVLRICLQAGQGLAAAHAADLVHRDFKPDNVLVGTDGRVRVTDFGLARHSLATDEDEGTSSQPADSNLRLTRTGALVGTPAYMAPEQHRGEAADRRSDQFAFCVTTWEALYGQRPFEGGTYAELAQNVAAGAIVDPPRTAVPIKIKAALRRGMSVDPAARFPSMQALLGALSLGPPRRWWAMLGAAAIVASVGVTWAITSRSAETSSCAGAADKLAGVWDPTRSGDVSRALAAIRGFGPQTATHTVAALDGYARRWSKSWTDTCAASHERREQSQGLFDLRVACLMQRLDTLRAVASAFAVTDAALATRADEVADLLAPIDPCDDPARLLETAMTPTETREAGSVRARVVAANTLRLQGKHAEARTTLDSALVEADRLKDKALRATVLLALGTLHMETGNTADAEEALQRAGTEALAGKDDDTAAQAFIALVDVVGYDLGRPTEAHRLAALAEGAIERAHRPNLKSELAMALARILLLEGKDDEALAALDEVAKDVSEPQEVAILSAKTRALFDLGRFDEALTSNTRELELRATFEGPNHPFYATTLSARANLHFVANEFELGLADLRRGREIVIAALGPDSPLLAEFENNLGVISGELGDWKEALRASQVATKLAERQGGAEHPDTLKARMNIGAALRELGRLAEAATELEATHELRVRALGPAHPDVGIGLQELAELRLAQDRVADALALFEQSQQTLTAALGAENPQLAYTTSGLGRAQLRAKKYADAKRTLTSTAAALEATGLDPVLTARTHLALAEATWRLGDHRSAIAIAAKAEPDLAPLPASSNQALRREISAWRAAHR